MTAWLPLAQAPCWRVSMAVQSVGAFMPGGLRKGWQGQRSPGLHGRGRAGFVRRDLHRLERGNRRPDAEGAGGQGHQPLRGPWPARHGRCRPCPRLHRAGRDDAARDDRRRRRGARRAARAGRGRAAPIADTGRGGPRHGRWRCARWRCASRPARADGRAVGDAARGAPGRRNLHPRPLRRAVVPPVAARRLGRTAARAQGRAVAPGTAWPSRAA